MTELGQRERLQPTPRAPRLSRPQAIAALYGALAAVAITWSTLAGRSIYVYPGTQASSLELGTSPLIGVVFGLCVVAASRWAVAHHQWARVLHHEFHALVHDLTPREILVLAIASSIGEELFFRGALQPVIGIFPSAALFAALHFRPDRRFLPWTTMSLIVGLAMGASYRFLGDLGAPILAHFTINFLNLHHIAKNEFVA